ncbi:hypothetical protein Emed_007442 [Eimeria media]
MGASPSRLKGKDYMQNPTEETEGRLWFTDADLEAEEEALRRDTHIRPHQAQDAEGENNLRDSFHSLTSTIYVPLSCSQTSVTPYMTFPSRHYPPYENYAFPSSRHPTEAPSQREQLLFSANTRLQVQISGLQLENQRLNQLIHQGQSILLERDNLTVVNRDQRRRLEIARQQWEKLQRDHEKLKDKVLRQEVLLGELPALRRQVTQVDHAKTLLTRKDNEIEVLREEIKSLKQALQGYKRLHKQDLETRVRAATQAKELEDAKTAIIVLKDELNYVKEQLRPTKRTEFLSPLSSPSTDRFRRTNKAPNDKPSPPSPHKMVDDEPSSQSSDASGMQLRSRKITKAPSSRRGEGGVTALMMGHGPSMTSEDDGSYPSANSHTLDKDEDNEHFEIRSNKKKDQHSSTNQQLHSTENAASKNETAQLQHMMTMLSKLTMRVEEQSRENDRYRQLIETLVRPNQQTEGSSTNLQALGTTREVSKEETAEHNKLPENTHVIWTPRQEKDKIEYFPMGYDKTPKSLVNKFNGQNPVQWIQVLEFEFTQWNVPEKDRYKRALTLMEEQVLHRYLIEKGEYEPTWEGIKKFVADWYGQAEEHTTCANLRGTKAAEGTECYLCKGKGHFARECANNQANGGRDAAWESGKRPGLRGRGGQPLRPSTSRTPSPPKKHQAGLHLVSYTERAKERSTTKGKAHRREVRKKKKLAGRKSGNLAGREGAQGEDEHEESYLASTEQEHVRLDTLKLVTKNWPTPTTEGWQQDEATRARPVKGITRDRALENKAYAEEEDEDLLGETTSDEELASREPYVERQRTEKNGLELCEQDEKTPPLNERKKKFHAHPKNEKNPRDQKQKNAFLHGGNVFSCSQARHPQPQTQQRNDAYLQTTADQSNAKNQGQRQQVHIEGVHAEADSQGPGSHQTADSSSCGLAIPTDGLTSTAPEIRKHTSSARSRRMTSSGQDLWRPEQQVQAIAVHQGDGSEWTTETGGTRRPPATVHAPHASFLLPSDAPRPPGEARAPHQWGGSSGRKVEEEQHVDQEEEDPENNLHHVEPWTRAAALSRGTRHRDNSNDAPEHNRPATAYSSFGQDWPYNTQTCDRYTRTSCRSRCRSLPPYPSLSCHGRPEQQEDTTQEDANHCHTQYTNPYLTKHKPDYLVFGPHEHLGQCEPCTTQLDDATDEVHLLPQAGSKKERTQRHQPCKTITVPQPKSSNEKSSPQKQDGSLLARCESEENQGHLGARLTRTCKDEDRVDRALAQQVEQRLENHRGNHETAPSKADKATSQRLWMKWRGCDNVALVSLDHQSFVQESETEKDFFEHQQPTQQTSLVSWTPSQRAEAAVQNYLEEETCATRRRRTHPQNPQKQDETQEQKDLEQLKELEEQYLEQLKGQEEEHQVSQETLTTRREGQIPPVGSPQEEGQQARASSSSFLQQLAPAIVREDKDHPTASPEEAQATADYHPLAFLKIIVKGKPVVALLDTGCTHILISDDLADELQLKKHTMETPTRMLLGNGEEMVMDEMTEELKCRTGELYFKITAILAPIPFDLILGQPFSNKERLMWGFGPSKLTGWRGGRRLVLPLSEEKPKTRTTTADKADLWKDREEIKEAHERLEKALRDRSRAEAEAMVRPSPKRYKNYKTAASRAHARKLANLAKEQAEGNLNIYMWDKQQHEKGGDKAARLRRARGDEPIKDGPPAPKPRDGKTELPTNTKGGLAEGKFLVIPKELSFQAQSDFIPSYNKFDQLAKEWKTTLPPKFYEMLIHNRDLFPDSLPPGLPARRIIDHRIPTVPDKLPPKGPIYQMDYKMKMAMKEELSKLAAKGYITLTSSPYAAPCMLVPKKSDKPGGPEQYRLVINYQELNKVTISSEQPIPNITTIMEQLQGAKYFTIMDMESGFHQVRMAPEDQHKTGFRCYLGHFEFKVMPFGLKGAPGTFQTIMTQILWEHIGIRCAVYLDDVLVYSPSLDKHIEDVAKVLKALRDNRMFPKITKCKFAQTELVYLGYSVGADGVRPSMEKVKDIVHWPEKLSKLHRYYNF